METAYTGEMEQEGISEHCGFFKASLFRDRENNL